MVRAVKGSLAAAVLAVAAPATGALAQEAAPVRLFGSWSVACDNAAQCLAINVSDHRLTISRDGHWDSLPVISLAGADRLPAATQIRLIGQVPVQVSGRHRRARFQLYHAGDGTLRIPRHDALAFLSAARNAAGLELLAGNTVLGDIGLAGIEPAMDLFDEVQTRTGTVTGIYTRGEILVPLAAIMPPPLPRVPAMTGHALPPDPAMEGRFHLLVCGTGVPRRPGDVEQAEMADGTRIIGAACSVTGINAGRLWLVQRPGGDPVPARFPLPYARQDDTGLGYQENSLFDPASATLSATMLQRPQGDCGASHRWQWTASGFVLIEATAMPHCIGLPQARWPRIWRTKPASSPAP